MSDYLWDKTGEVDPEAEHLETLLGRLRFQPTPFDLPAELPAKDFRAAPPRRDAVTWPRLALAASLTLAVLAGAWLALRQQIGTTSDAPQLATQNNQAGGGDKLPNATAPSVTAPNAPAAATEDGVPDEKKGIENPAVAPSPSSEEKRREERGGARPRPRLPDLAGDRQRRPARSGAQSATVAKRRSELAPPAPAPREETARAGEREAVEKVLYALRVTSEKLNYARRQVQESGRGEANR